MQYLTKNGVPLLRHLLRPIHLDVIQAIMQVAQAIQSAQADMQVGPVRTAIGGPGEILHPLVVGGTIADEICNGCRRLMAGMHKTINRPISKILVATVTDKATTSRTGKTTNGTAHSPIDLKHLRVRLKEVQEVGVEDDQRGRGQELVHQEILGPSIIESSM
jgi:hypothetical protein